MKTTITNEILEWIGDDKDTENVEIPEGANIGEYKFCEVLRREGYNQALSDLCLKAPELTDTIVNMIVEDLLTQMSADDYFNAEDMARIKRITTNL